MSLAPAENYYAILGISGSATTQEIKKRYRLLSHAYHPDKFGGSDGLRDSAGEEFRRISRAYGVLIDPTLRAEYDRRQRDSVSSAAKANKVTPRPQPRADSSARRETDRGRESGQAVRDPSLFPEIGVRKRRLSAIAVPAIAVGLIILIFIAVGDIIHSIRSLGDSPSASLSALQQQSQHDTLQERARQDSLKRMQKEWPDAELAAFDSTTVYGDLTGDGIAEAAVWTRYRPDREATTSTFSQVFVYAVANGRVELLGTLEGGDRAQGGIESVRIVNNQLILGRYRPQKENPCVACYGFIETTIYRWNVDSLTTVSVSLEKAEKLRH